MTDPKAELKPCPELQKVILDAISRTLISSSMERERIAECTQHRMANAILADIAAAWNTRTPTTFNAGLEAALEVVNGYLDITYCRDIAQRISALKTAPGADGWNYDMDAAPQEGQLILLSCRGHGETIFVSEGSYEEDRGWYEANTHSTDAVDGQVFPYAWKHKPDPATPPSPEKRDE